MAANLTPENEEKLVKAKQLISRGNRLLRQVTYDLEPEPDDTIVLDPIDGIHFATEDHWQYLIEQPGSSITHEEPDVFRMHVVESSGRVRCEMQANVNNQTYSTPIPDPLSQREYGFDFSLVGDVGVVQSSSKGVTICQWHTDAKMYSGGLALRANGEVVWRVVGAAGQGSDQDINIVIGEWVPGIFNTFRGKARWTSSDNGFITGSINGDEEVHWQGSTAPSEATKQKYRVGIYTDPSPGYEFVVKDVRAK